MATQNAINIGVVPGGGFTYTFPSGSGTLYSTASASITSAQLATSLSDETGTGVAVFATSPSLTTPSFSSIVNTGTLTLPTSTDTLIGRATTDTLTNKTLTTPTINGAALSGTLSGTPTFSGAIVFSSSIQPLTIELGAATDTTISRVSAGVIAVEGVTVVDVSSAQTLTTKRITKRVTSTTSGGATPTIATDTNDMVVFTAQAAAITNMSTNTTGTPTNGQTLWISITDNATARAITWGTLYEASTVALPTTTVVSTRLDVGFVWNVASGKWRCVAVA